MARISVCASGANTVSPPVEAITTCRFSSGALSSTLAGTATVKTALVCPAWMVTWPLGRVPPKLAEPRKPGPG